MIIDKYLKQLTTLDKPREIKIEVTPRCNCNCNFCVNRATFVKGGVRPKNELSTSQVMFIIDKVKECGIEKIRFTGGEPLLREDIFQLLEYAKRKKLKTVLNTNCTLLSNPEKIKLVGKFVDIILVSLISTNNEGTDKVLGIKGAFEKKIKVLNDLKKTKTKIWACTVLTPSNIKKLEEFHKLAEKLSISHWFLLRQTPTKENHAPTKSKDMILAIKKIHSFKKECSKMHFIENAVPFCVYNPEITAKVVYDGAFFVEAQSKLVINPFGKIQVDYAVDKPIGDVFKDNLLSAWNTGFAYKLRKLEMVPTTCKKCRYLILCRGGSRFAAKMASGSYYNMDPLANPNNLS